MCGKRIFLSPQTAEADRRARDLRTHEVYKCRFCPYWHLASGFRVLPRSRPQRPPERLNVPVAELLAAKASRTDRAGLRR